jgi:hypothetical protein
MQEKLCCTVIHTFSTVISDISEGYLKDLHASQQSSSFSVSNLPEYVQNIITAQANQQAQSSQFGFQQQQQVLQPQQPQQQVLQPQQPQQQVLQPQQPQQLDTAAVQQQNQFQQECFVLQCDQTITGRNLQYSRQNNFSCEISLLKFGGSRKDFFLLLF